MSICLRSFETIFQSTYTVRTLWSEIDLFYFILLGYNHFLQSTYVSKVCVQYVNQGFCRFKKSAWHRRARALFYALVIHFYNIAHKQPSDIAWHFKKVPDK